MSLGLSTEGQFNAYQRYEVAPADSDCREQSALRVVLFRGPFNNNCYFSPIRFLPCSKNPPYRSSFTRKIRWCCLRSYILALCATNIHQASVQSISNNPSCNQSHLNNYRGGRVWRWKRFGYGSAVLWNLCNSNLTTNDKGKGEFAAMATWNSSRYREAVFQHSRHFAGKARTSCLSIKDLWPLLAFIIHLTCWFVDDARYSAVTLLIRNAIGRSSLLDSSTSNYAYFFDARFIVDPMNIYHTICCLNSTERGFFPSGPCQRITTAIRVHTVDPLMLSARPALIV